MTRIMQCGNQILFMLAAVVSFSMSPAHAYTSSSGPGFDILPPGEIRVENLAEGQRITAEVPTEFHVSASEGVVGVKVYMDGEQLGEAKPHPESRQFRFGYTFASLGEHEIAFSAYGETAVPLSTSSHKIYVAPEPAKAPASRSFNAYVLKAVSYLTKKYGLMGYDITAQLTHPVDYHKYGTLKPTKGGLTMCVSGVLETIVTAMQIYAQESKDYSVFQFLPFKSWNTLASDAIKAHIWVNPKLKSFGTADAITKFGMGERLKFRDLTAGSFININRDRPKPSGHAVVFLGFINIKGEDVAHYDSSVVGFRYFGAQGKSKKGQGGLSYRHAFFKKYGCPNVPYKKDCDIILSDDPRLLNVGQMLSPKNWRKKPAAAEEDLNADLPPLTEEEERAIQLPQDFDGLTTDD